MSRKGKHHVASVTVDRDSLKGHAPIDYESLRIEAIGDKPFEKPAVAWRTIEPVIVTVVDSVIAEHIAPVRILDTLRREPRANPVFLRLSEVMNYIDDAIDAVDEPTAEWLRQLKADLRGPK